MSETMPTTDTAVDLAQYARNLADQRDAHIATAERSFTQGAVEFNVGFAAGMALALALLHIATSGEHGALQKDQPDPWSVPVAGAESSRGGES